MDIDGTTYSADANTFFFEELRPAAAFDTGWVEVTFDIGALTAGAHTITFGALNTRKTETGERLDIRFDDVAISENNAGTSTGTVNEIYGGFGLDTLFGSTETDHFIFEAASAFTNTDLINNFDISELDVIDISDLLTGFTVGVSDISDFVQITTSGANSILSVSGAGTGTSYQAVAQINGLTGIDETSLFNNGSLIAV